MCANKFTKIIICKLFSWPTKYFDKKLNGYYDQRGIACDSNIPRIIIMRICQIKQVLWWSVSNTLPSLNTIHCF